MRHYLQFGHFGFKLSGTQALVMGILNITPDSFSDAGQYQLLEFALSRAEQINDIMAGLEPRPPKVIPPRRNAGDNGTGGISPNVTAPA